MSFEPNRPLYMIKFMEKQYIKSFLEEGLLYMNNIKFYREYEEKNVRGDIYEGLSATLSPNQVFMKWGEVEFKSLVGKIDIRREADDNINIYSMSMIRLIDVLDTVKNELKLSESFASFGDSCIIISGENIPVFFERLKKALHESKNIAPIIKDKFATKVEYVNRKNFHGEMTIFQKFNEYNWQYEWRIALRQSKTGHPYELRLGSLKDIAQVYDADELLAESIKMIENGARI